MLGYCTLRTSHYVVTRSLLLRAARKPRRVERRFGSFPSQGVRIVSRAFSAYRSPARAVQSPSHRNAGGGERGSPYRPHRPCALVTGPQSGNEHSDRRVSTWRMVRLHLRLLTTALICNDAAGEVAHSLTLSTADAAPSTTEFHRVVKGGAEAAGLSRGTISLQMLSPDRP
jgi:hypothetical protein